jgi:23S rRNA (cytosine1962-C5)-methyltransferase
MAKNERRLRSWRNRHNVTCYRLYDADIPEVPLSIDLYETVAPRTETHLVVSVYRRRSLPTGADLEEWIDAMCVGAAEAVGTSAEFTHCRQRQRQRGLSQYEAVKAPHARYQVEEHGHRFWINFDQYLDTGLFLDHRPTRQAVQKASLGRRVLNLFAYTGAFSVYAAAGGALTTTTVDLSKTYLNWCADNLRLNGFEPGAHRLVHADVFEFLEGHRGCYDLVICDPPTFSNSKRMQNVFDVQRDHSQLLLAVERLLTDDGTVWFSTNSRRFKPDEKTLGQFQEISDTSVPPDFRNRKIHRCWRYTRPNRSKK